MHFKYGISKHFPLLFLKRISSSIPSKMHSPQNVYPPNHPLVYIEIDAPNNSLALRLPQKRPTITTHYRYRHYRSRRERRILSRCYGNTSVICRKIVIFCILFELEFKIKGEKFSEESFLCEYRQSGIFHSCRRSDGYNMPHVILWKTFPSQSVFSVLYQ